MNDSFESIISALTDVAQSAANKARSLGAVAKSNIDLFTEQEKLKKAYTELGKLYYRDYVTGEEPDDAEYLPLCDKITELVKSIDGLRGNIETARSKREKEVIIEDEEIDKALAEELEDLNDELKDVDDDLKDLEEEMADLEAERKELEEQRAEIEAEIRELTVKAEEVPEEPACECAADPTCECEAPAEEPKE